MEPERRARDLSPAQRDLICDEIDRVVKKYARGALAAYVFVLVACAYLFYAVSDWADESRRQIIKSGNIVSISGCNRDFEDREAIRGVLIASQFAHEQAYEEGAVTLSEYQRGKLFYKAQLDNLPLPDCRKSTSVLTDDPDKPLTPPRALYPALSQEDRSTDNGPKSGGR